MKFQKFNSGVCRYFLVNGDWKASTTVAENCSTMREKIVYLVCKYYKVGETGRAIQKDGTLIVQYVNGKLKPF
jgi:hypothetical protein